MVFIHLHNYAFTQFNKSKYGGDIYKYIDTVLAFFIV